MGHGIVDGELKSDTQLYETEDVADIIRQFFHPEEVLFLESLCKTTFLYRMLCVSLSLYQMSPFQDQQLLIIRKTKVRSSTKVWASSSSVVEPSLHALLCTTECTSLSVVVHRHIPTRASVDRSTLKTSSCANYAKPLLATRASPCSVKCSRLGL